MAGTANGGGGGGGGYAGYALCWIRHDVGVSISFFR